MENTATHQVGEIDEGAEDSLSTNDEERKRLLTERGKAFRLQNLQDERKTTGAALRRQITKVSSLLQTNTSDITVVEHERDILDSHRDKMNDAHENLYKELQGTEELSEAYQWFDVRDREYLQCRMKIVEALRRVEKQVSESESERKSLISSRTRSSKRSTSSMRSRRAEAAARAACLEVEMDFLEREAEYKKLLMQKELAKARAEEETIRKIEEEIQEETNHKASIPDVKPKVTLKTEFDTSNNDNILNPRAQTFEPSGTMVIQSSGNTPTHEIESGMSNNKSDELNSVVRLVAEQQRISLLPAQQPPTFSGNYFDYPAFVSAFECLIECRVTDPKQRLYYLSQYTSGSAKESIKGLINLESPDSYEKARKILKERFGHPYRVAQAYKEKLNSWPPIREGDGASLQQFSDFLTQCEEAMKILKYMEGLNSEDTLKKISSKLPSYSGVRWCRLANKILRSEERLATFHDVVEFIKKEAELATDPVFSPEALKEARKNEFTNSGKNSTRKPNEKGDKSCSSYFTGIIPPGEKSNCSAVCPLCKNDDHNLDNCLSFKKKTLDERKLYVKKAGLCFGCLRFGHVSKGCRKRNVCKTCSKPHPTVLHEESKNVPKDKEDQANKQTAKDSKKDEVTSSCISTCNAIETSVNVTNSMIVPVRLHHVEDPQHQVIIYALLDPASNGTFIKEGILKKLHISGVETQLQLNTMHGTETVQTCKVGGLIVERMDKEVHIELPKSYSRKEIPSKRNEIPRPESAKGWPHLSQIANKIYPYQANLEVGLLIGSNCPKAIKPRQVIPGRSSDPYAIRTSLGWGIIGPITGNPNKDSSDAFCNQITIEEIGAEETSSHCFVVETTVKEIISPAAVKRMFESDFNEAKDAVDQPISMDDRRFMAKVTDGIRHRIDGHYELPLPLRDESLTLPNNKGLAVHRLRQLKSRFERDNNYKTDYTAFMSKMIENGYAEKVPSNEDTRQDGKVWFLPHHGVYNPQKPGKIRVVFDCSAEYKGESLNKHLLQGPDLTNKLVGVLSRFRQEDVAFIADIEAMFLQVYVSEHYRDLLCFLWWEDGDLCKEPIMYRMAVHLFGAGSSPGCCNFALKKTADDHEREIGTEPAEFLRRDFYVDDGLKSVPSTNDAKKLINQTKVMCHRGGFNLHKFTSNKREVIEAIPTEDRAEGIKELDLQTDKLPVEKALGVHWCIESDSFKFRIVLQDRPLTRRGILSTVSTIYDPLGFLAPLLLVGKKVLQDLCRGKVDWDDPIPEATKTCWMKWRNDLHLLEKFSVPRCFKPENFGTAKSIQLHHFSDASTVGYGQCSYLRLENDQGNIHCSLVMGKARVAPLKSITIPRLELSAAVVSVRVSNMLRQELQYERIQEVFWTDSQVVLGYINNESKRFHIFVANRVQQIRDRTSPSQWRHVDTKANPADDASRGLTAKEMLESPRWISGPEFLWKSEDQWPPSSEKQDLELAELLSGDAEVKNVTAHATITQKLWSLVESLTYFSDWNRARRAIAICMRYKQILGQLISKKKQPGCMAKTARDPKGNSPANFKFLTVEEIKLAEKEIFTAVQGKAFPGERSILKNLPSKEEDKGRSSARQRKIAIRIASSLSSLDPFVDQDGVLRVGGRIRRGKLSADEKFPILLPRKSHVTYLIVKFFHERVQHQGRGMTLNEVRSSGFWVIGGTSAVSNFIHRCVTCRKLRGAVQEQKMSDLPEDRLESAPPFSYCAVDYCGPWYIKEGRKEVKRYVALFTCMASRAVHLEVSRSLETDSFLNALRRFICRRGPIRQLRSDQGSNFVGAKRELREGLEAMDHRKIGSELLKENCDWITFKMNPPSASHAGGVWERQIRTLRSVLTALLEKNGGCLDGESFQTLICETEAIVNSRPLTVNNLSDPDSLSPLTPNHLLTMKTKPVLPPPGVFQGADQYSRKRWRRVQHLACQFWDRWRKEYLLNLQERSKWTKPRRNLQIGDVVIVKDDNKPRCRWNLARVEETYPSKDGLVRSVKIEIGDPNLTGTGKKRHPVSVLDRPVQKLVLLLPHEERQDSQTGSHPDH